MSRWGRFPDLAAVEFLDDGRRVQLWRAFPYERSDGVVIVVPNGFVCDGASIPRILWPVTDSPFTGNNLRPALIHDYLCHLGRQGVCRWHSREVHYMFHQGLRAEGERAWMARAKWATLRAVGPRFKGSEEPFTPTIR